MRGAVVLALALLPGAVVAQQGTGPTVGDTVVIARPVTLPAGAVVRPLPFQGTRDVDLLGTPRVAAGEGGSVVEYPLVFWRPGDHTVNLPGVAVIRADGRADTLPPYRATVTIASVLPERATGDTAPAPQPAVPVIVRTTSSPLPVLVLLLVAGLLLLPLHLWWRRRGKPAPLVHPPFAHDEVRLRRWVEQGETRAAIEQWLARLTPPPGEAADPHPESVTLREALAAARWSPPDPEAEAALCRRAAAHWSQADVSGEAS